MAEGFLNVVKPPGLTSQQVVAEIRRLFGGVRAGHTGTLDPGAAGVLPVALGRATRLIPFLPEGEKGYRAEVTFGIETETGDGGGRVTRIHRDWSAPLERLLALLPSFTGEQLQAPPRISARRYRGRRLYEWARLGAHVPVQELQQRIVVHSLRLVPGPGALPPVLAAGTRLVLDVRCSRGTYVRALCEALGRSLGAGAHCSFLLRTESGPFRLAEARSLEELGSAASEERRAWLIDGRTVLAHLPEVQVGPGLARRIAAGQAVERAGDGPAVPEGGLVRLCVGPRLVAVGEAVGGRIVPRRVLAGPAKMDGG